MRLYRVTIFLCACALAFCCLAASAQYNQKVGLFTFAFGIKWYAPGISAKFSSGEGDVIECEAFDTKKYKKFALLYETQRSITDDLNWYAGGGAHLTVWEQSFKAAHNMQGSDGSLGFDTVVGLDYRPSDSPIDITLSWQPEFTFMGKYNGKNKFDLPFGGIGIALAF